MLGTAILVRRLPDPPERPCPEQLLPREGETLRHRHVELMAADRVVSEADLWYLPDRLPRELVATLETTPIPFGRVMQPLRLKRVPFSARFPADRKVRMEHRAVLTLPDGTGVAEVWERYPWTLFGAS